MKYLLFVSLYLILFGPKFIFLDFLVVTNVVFAILAVYFVFKNKTFFAEMWQLILVNIIMISYGLFLVIIYQLNEFTIVAEYIKLLIYTLSVFGIVKLYSQVYKKNFFEIILKHIFYSIIIVMLTVCVMFISKEIRTFILPLLDMKMANMFEVQQGIRFIDLSVGAGTTLSLVFFIGFVLNIYLIQNKILRGFFYTLSPYLLIFTSLLVGRTGFILIAIYGTYLLIFNFKIKLRISKLYAYNILSLAIIILCFVYVLTAFPILTEKILPWAVEFMFSFLSTGSLTTASTSDLMVNHYHFNFSGLDLFFGRNEFETNTDVGYLIILYSNGFIGIILFIFWHLILFLKTRGGNSKLFKFNGLVNLIFIIVLMVNFKELIFTNSRGLFILVLMIAISVFEFNKKIHIDEDDFSLHSHL